MRRVAIHFYWLVWTAAEEYDLEEKLISPFQKDEIIDKLFDDLAVIVRALPVDQVPADWNYVAWEITNARLIRDHNRALALYNVTNPETRRPRGITYERVIYRFIRGSAIGPVPGCRLLTAVAAAHEIILALI